MSNLATILADLAAKHDCHVVEFGMNLKQSAESRYDVTLHWEGYTNSGHNCVGEHGATCEEALEKAIVKMREERLAPLALPDLEIAA